MKITDRRVSRPRGGARRASTKVTNDMRQAAVDIIDEHPEFTLDQINAELRRRHPQGAPISRTTLASVLSGQLIVLKKLEDAPTDRNSIQVKDLRFDFADWLMREGLQHNLVFIDEAGLNL